MLSPLDKRKLSIILFPILLTLIFAVSSYYYHINWCEKLHFSYTKPQYVFYTLANLIILLIWPCLNYFYLIPSLFKSKYIWLILLLQIPLLYASLYAHALLDTFFLSKYKVDWLMSEVHINSRLFINVAFALLFSVFKAIVLLFDKQEQQSKLQLAQVESDMKFLRSQINPHFLFNSLNNIYSYALQKKEETPELILKLSDILRFLATNKPSKEAGSSKKEIIVAKQLVELYLVNKRWQSKVKLSIDPQLLENDYPIEPHSILTLVENTFKHTGLDEENGFVDLKISLENGIKTEIKNSIRTDKKPEKSGIGLENLLRRLTITHQTNYTYQTHTKNGVYHVILILPLPY